MSLYSFARYIGLDEEERKEVARATNPVMDKKFSVRNYILYMLDRTSQMFEYDGLPPTMPAIQLERMLQTIGIVVVARVPKNNRPRGYGIDFSYKDLREHDWDTDTPYVFPGNLGEAPDPYLSPFKAIIANPGFEPTYDANMEINKDCVVIRNDRELMGLIPMFRRYAWAMEEAALSMRSALVNLREQRVITAPTDRAYQSAMEYLGALERGELGVIMDEPVLAGSKIWGAEGRANAVIQAIEALQYVKSAWFNEVGLQSAFNMKREYLSEKEVLANTDLLKPLVDDMLTCRQRGIDDVNAMFGLNITVRKNSAWENKERETQASIEESEAEADEVASATSGGGEDV